MNIIIMKLFGFKLPPCRHTMLKTMFPSLNTLANVCLSIPVGTVSVEWSFLQMKMIKTRLRNCIGETSLSYLMKIAPDKICDMDLENIESPEKLCDMDLENIVNIWNRRVVVQVIIIYSLFNH